MSMRPPRYTRTDTPFPDTTLFRPAERGVAHPPRRGGKEQQRHRGDDTPRHQQQAHRPVRSEAAPVAGEQIPGRNHDRRHQQHRRLDRSEEHTSELQSLMRISYAVFFSKKKTTPKTINKSTPR